MLYRENVSAADDEHGHGEDVHGKVDAHQVDLVPIVRHFGNPSDIKGQVTFLKLFLLVMCLALVIPRYTLFL